MSPPRPGPDAAERVREIVAALDARVGAGATTAEVRAVRRDLTRALRDAPAPAVLALADALVERDAPFDRFVAYELVAAHRATMASLDAPTVRRLGRGMDGWADGDTFACYVAGPAWREGHLPDAELARWAASPDRWWRRAALASTVALNNRARGGRGDPARTLAACERALGDRDDMVVKALSWALRELAKRAPADVARFVAEHEGALAARVRREVRTKLTTGLKAPPRRLGEG
jgi:3-methyladenine DNA glycosylase AlkD